jgi:hypothetical protein
MKKAKKGKKAKPAGRHSHTAVAWRDSMFVFGGATADPSGVPSGQLLEFNFRTPLPQASSFLSHIAHTSRLQACTTQTPTQMNDREGGVVRGEDQGPTAKASLGPLGRACRLSSSAS